jgi:hypothetical protein
LVRFKSYPSGWLLRGCKSGAGSYNRQEKKYRFYRRMIALIREGNTNTNSVALPKRPNREVSWRDHIQRRPKWHWINGNREDSR